MKPEANDILEKSAAQLMGQLAPQLAASYAHGSAALLALLMKFAAREYERGADIRAAENTDMRVLFAELAPSVRDVPLKARLKVAADKRDPSLTISALNAANNDLRRLLIELQVHIEGIGARAAEKRIWGSLKAMAVRRAVSLF